jgi:hypothetical protein
MDKNNLVLHYHPQYFVYFVIHMDVEVSPAEPRIRFNQVDGLGPSKSSCAVLAIKDFFFLPKSGYDKGDKVPKPSRPKQTVLLLILQLFCFSV